MPPTDRSKPYLLGVVGEFFNSICDRTKDTFLPCCPTRHTYVCVLHLFLSPAIRSETSGVGHCSARRGEPIDPFDESLGGGGGGENIHLTRLEINKGGIGKSLYAEMLSSSPPPGMKQMQVRELLNLFRI